MRIAICDDNLEFLTQAQSLVHSWQEQRRLFLSISSFQDGDSLIHAHSRFPFDIILLDVVMPLLNGLDTAREIRQSDRQVKIVFLTTSPDFAVESYTVQASNYLLKPLAEDKLIACLDELYLQLRRAGKSISLKNANTVHRVMLDTVEYVEAQNKRVLFSLQDGQAVYSQEPLYAYEALLGLEDGFFKCSRSYIVNIHHIDSYTAKEVKMRSGCRIPISRGLNREFENAYFSVLFGKAGEQD